MLSPGVVESRTVHSAFAQATATLRERATARRERKEEFASIVLAFYQQREF